MAEVPQHRGYHQIARDKPHSFKIRLVGKPRSLSIESPLHDLPRTWPLQLRPFFISIAEVDKCEVLHERLNGFRSSESPLNGPGAGLRILWPQDLGQLVNLEHDGAGLKQGESVLLLDDQAGKPTIAAK